MVLEAAIYVREENMLWSAVVILQEGADLAEEIAALPTTEDPDKLRKDAAEKRRLYQRIREVVLDLPKSSTTDGSM